MRKGDTITGSIANRKSLTNFRELDIKISYHLNGAQKSDLVNMYKNYFTNDIQVSLSKSDKQEK